MSIKGKKIVATIEARMTSSRLPGKVLMDLAGKPNLERIIERVRRSKYVDEICVATTSNETDNQIVDLCKTLNCKYYRGSEDDVLLRVLDAAKSVEADIIVEITGDCPVIDWRHIDYLLEKFFSDKYDYVSNIIERSFPRGFDVQVFPVSVLEKVNQLTQNPIDHEHVSLYIYRHPEIFKLGNWKAEGKMFNPDMEITLDHKADYDMISKLYNDLLFQNIDFSAEDVVDHLLNNPELLSEVRKIKRKKP